MSDGMDIQFVRENYQRMTDDELIRVATQDAAGLTPEAQEVVKVEIQRRGLDTGIVQAVEAQNKQHTIEEIDQYCELLRSLECSSCGSSANKLNATLTSKVMSFIVLTQYSRKLKIACPDCLDKSNNEALWMTAAFGWWGIPWGIIRSIQAIILNIKSKKTNHVSTPNNYLRDIVWAKIGEVELHKNDREELQRIISTI